MRILVCPQEFKGSLTAREAAAAMADGIRRAASDIEVDVAPMADGGPGTVEAVLSSTAGRLMTATVDDPLSRSIEVAWGLLDDGPTAVIEMAAASGLLRLKTEELDPLRASTYGTGQLILAALDAGCRKLIVGVGGSATNDGGAGMAQALGARLLDSDDTELPRGGAALARLARIDVSGLDARLAECRVTVATDVVNPLCGPTGASRLYGPQKGATPTMVESLEAALRRYGEVVGRDLGVDIVDLAGAGAAGGLGGGLVAFLKAQVRSGAELVAEAVGLRARLVRADIVFTGEGRIDAQTAFGKTIAVVARLAQAEGRPVVAIGGSVEGDGKALASKGVSALLSIARGPMSEAEMRENARPLLMEAAEQAMRLVLLARKLA